MASAALGFCLSLIIWKQTVVNLQQREHIECQQKKLKEKNRELKHLATFDFLTGLMNRRVFVEEATREIYKLRDRDRESCFIVLDIDNFKSVNDNFGHPVGDAVLESFALFLKSELRDYDIVARIGGEEFAILLKDVGYKQGVVIVERMRTRLEKKTFVIDGHDINITMSAGLSSMDATTDSFELCYQMADRALYTAKTKGKNKIEMIR